MEPNDEDEPGDLTVEDLTAMCDEELVRDHELGLDPGQPIPPDWL